jgi:hypothetical protein
LSGEGLKEVFLSSSCQTNKRGELIRFPTLAVVSGKYLLLFLLGMRECGTWGRNLVFLLPKDSVSLMSQGEDRFFLAVLIQIQRIGTRRQCEAFLLINDA